MDAQAIPIRVLAMEADGWDPISATWDFAVDSLNERRPWPQPGAGPPPSLRRGSGSLPRGSLLIRIDSATVAAWGGHR